MNFNQSWVFEDPIEIIAKVECYIHIKTGKNIRINPNGVDMNKLMIAYSHAQAFFKEYGTHFTLIR